MADHEFKTKLGTKKGRCIVELFGSPHDVDQYENAADKGTELIFVHKLISSANDQRASRGV